MRAILLIAILSLVCSCDKGDYPTEQEMNRVDGAMSSNEVVSINESPINDGA